jgi:hypothetical protein
MEIEALIATIRQRLAFGLQAEDLADLVAAHGSGLVWLAYVAARQADA